VIFLGGWGNWALTRLPERGVFRNSSASTSRRRDGVARHALGTPSDDCDSVRIRSYGLRIECRIALGTEYVARKPDPLAKYTKQLWLYPPLPLTKERWSVGRAPPHKLASRWCPFLIYSSNGLG